MKNYQSFLSENFQFLELNFSIYLNRRVFVMDFDYIGGDIRHFSNFGNVYLCGDLNGRCCLLPDRVEQFGLGQFVNLPVEDDLPFPTAARETRHDNC